MIGWYAAFCGTIGSGIKPDLSAALTKTNRNTPVFALCRRLAGYLHRRYWKRRGALSDQKESTQS
jgi:hypothetical protein